MSSTDSHLLRLQGQVTAQSVAINVILAVLAAKNEEDGVAIKSLLKIMSDNSKTILQKDALFAEGFSKTMESFNSSLDVPAANHT